MFEFVCELVILFVSFCGSFINIILYYFVIYLIGILFDKEFFLVWVFWWDFFRCDLVCGLL